MNFNLYVVLSTFEIYESHGLKGHDEMSEIKCLCLRLMKRPSQRLEKLSYFWNTKIE